MSSDKLLDAGQKHIPFTTVLIFLLVIVVIAFSVVRSYSIFESFLADKHIPFRLKMPVGISEILVHSLPLSTL